MAIGGLPTFLNSQPQTTQPQTTKPQPRDPSEYLGSHMSTLNCMMGVRISPGGNSVVRIAQMA